MNNKVILGDNMEYMKTIADNYFELAIVDPPYGIGAENHAGSKKNGWNQWDKKEWDKNTPNKEYFEELKRISKNQIVWGGNYMTEYLNPSMCWIVWDKKQRDFSLADGEMAWTSFKKAMRIFDYARGSALANDNKNGGKIHPTQKPVALYKWLLKNYAKPGDKIFDSHVGSGSIRIACHDMGFDFTGCEIDKDYYKDQETRFKNHTKQGDLFGGKELQGNIYFGDYVGVE
jgi:site-specific DNA-methyltransferase (adenine-specific)